MSLRVRLKSVKHEPVVSSSGGSSPPKNKRFAGFRQAFIVFAQSTLTIQPCKSALHNPAFRQYLKADLTAQLSHNLQRPSQSELHPVDQLPTVATVSPYELQPAIVLDPPKQFPQHLSRPIAVLHVPGSHPDQQNQAQRVYNQMTLSPLRLLSCVITQFSTAFHCFHRLAIQNDRTGLTMSSFFFSQRFAQICVHLDPVSILSPQPEVVVHRFPRRHIMRQQTPGRRSRVM